MSTPGEWLFDCASQLTKNHHSAVDVQSLLARLGIELVVRDRCGNSRLGEAQKVRRGVYRIVLYTDAGRTSTDTRDRFTLAHELGHVLLDHRFGITPAGRDEYWGHERWCNAFAGRLLVPDVALAKAPGCDAKSLLTQMWTLGRRYKVSAIVVARRFVETQPGLAFVCANRELTDQGERVARVAWSASSDPEIALRPGALLSARDPLGHAMLSPQATFALTSPPNRSGVVGRAGSRVTACSRRAA